MCLLRRLRPMFASVVTICPLYAVFNLKAGGLARGGPISERKYLESTLLNKNYRGKGVRGKSSEP